MKRRPIKKADLVAMLSMAYEVNRQRRDAMNGHKGESIQQAQCYAESHARAYTLAAVIEAIQHNDSSMLLTLAS